MHMHTQAHRPPPPHTDKCLSCTLSHFLLHTSSHLVSYTHILLRTHAVFSHSFFHMSSPSLPPLRIHTGFLSTLRACGSLSLLTLCSGSRTQLVGVRM